MVMYQIAKVNYQIAFALLDHADERNLKKSIHEGLISRDWAICSRVWEGSANHRQGAKCRWSAGELKSLGAFRDQALDQTNTELTLLLSRGGWRCVAHGF